MIYLYYFFNIEINIFLNILFVSYWLDKWNMYKMLDLKIWDEVELIWNVIVIFLFEGLIKYLLLNLR